VGPGEALEDSITPGGALAGGTSPSPWITVAVGGGIAAANTITGATVLITPGGAIGGGNEPVEVGETGIPAHVTGSAGDFAAIVGSVGDRVVVSGAMAGVAVVTGGVED
jgi:hypothetical protein